MNAIIIEAPNRPPEMVWNDSVFLAGGITNVRDWQKDACDLLSEHRINIFNPRRKDFDINNPLVNKEQITWEHKYLRFCDTILFWFSHETLQPITLFELGGALERKQNLIIGCDPNYPRINDIIIQCSLQGYRGSIFNDLESMVDFYTICLTCRD